MKFTTKARYGLRAAFALAKSYSAPISLKDIASDQQIAEKYLEQLLASLKKAGMVETIRGSQGGYVLSRTPAEITVGEVIIALEGDFAITDCQRDGSCSEQSTCATRKIWTRISDAVSNALESVTLQDMLDDFNKDKEQDV